MSIIVITRTVVAALVLIAMYFTGKRVISTRPNDEGDGWVIELEK